MLMEKKDYEKIDQDKSFLDAVISLSFEKGRN